VQVVVPYEPDVNPLARSALERFAKQATYVRLGDGRTAYWQLLDRLWREARSFILVEHDVEIHERAIRVLTRCPQPWCLFPYSGPRVYGDGGDTLFYGALGCTRFRAQLMVNHPSVVSDIGQIERSGIEPATYRDWRGLDGRILSTLGGLGYKPHVHWPAVLHHHLYPSGCSCGDDDCEERTF
jgi:hypothetical protein